jgi:homoserine dehydrogenase
MKRMRVALLGFGSVGQGVARMLGEKDLPLTLTGIADSKGAVIDPDGISIPDALARKKKTGSCGKPKVTALDIVGSDAYDVLVEVTPTDMATGEPALTHIRTALGLGRHVVTSNKGPVALAHRELVALAAEKGVAFRYEATVCGAIPIIRTLRDGLLGNEVRALFGVMNGTCNFILTRMEDEGLTYDQALGEAQELGYAEKDPTYDVKGLDTAIKLVILANTVWDMAGELTFIGKGAGSVETASAVIGDLLSIREQYAGRP